MEVSLHTLANSDYGLLGNNLRRKSLRYLDCYY